MTVNKRSKKSRMRASHTHGWGAKKKHRGAGNRGGKGGASTGARSDAKKPSVWKDVKFFGKHGFKKKNIPVIFNCITLRDLEERAAGFEADKKLSVSGGVYSIKLEDVGFNKLLGTGQVTRKWKITVPYAVPNAVAKVKEAGGSVEGISASSGQ